MTIQEEIRSFDSAAAYLRQRMTITPEIGVILGSGLGGFADSVSERVEVSYPEIPHWPVATVAGHEGRLVAGSVEGYPLVVLQGRVHYYEGYEVRETVFPIRVLQRLGIRSLIITNAAGAIHPEYQPGDLMLIRDQLNFLGMGGAHPLRGPNDDSLGPRFPDMSRAFDPVYRMLARQCAEEAGLVMREGVYACVAGPSFETPAEIRFLKMAGADAVGMSTAAEVVVARHAGMRVLGVSGITNKADPTGSSTTEHKDVLAVGRDLVPKLERLLIHFLRKLGQS